MYLYMTYMKLDEKAESERYEFALQKDLVIDMKKFKMKVVEIKDNSVEFLIFDNDGIKDHQKYDDLKGTERILIDKETEKMMEIGKVYQIFSNTMEDWTFNLRKEQITQGVYYKFNIGRIMEDPNAIPVTNAEEFRKALEETE